MRIGQWLKQAFEVDQVVGQEYKFPCPRCGGDNFYFNTAKKLGFCHHADCHWSPKVQDLIDKIGYGPEVDGGYLPPIEPLVKTRAILPTELPEDSRPVIASIDGVECTYNEDAYKYLLGRGLTKRDIIRFNIQTTSERIYVPVYETVNDKVTMISYVSRGIYKKGYLYPSGGTQTMTLFGWDEAKHWPNLLLVENTFVSIWLRDKFHCVSTFGSHLSKEQIIKISQSAAKEVVFAWDGGSEASAQKAVRRLREVGKNAIFLKLPNKSQPDDYSPACIAYNVDIAAASLRDGKQSKDWENEKWNFMEESK